MEPMNDAERYMLECIEKGIEADFTHWQPAAQPFDTSKGDLMTTPTAGQYPPEAPDFVALIKKNLDLSGTSFTSLGVGLFDFLESAGHDVREAVLLAIQRKLETYAKGEAMPPSIRLIIVEHPAATGMMIAAAPRALAVWTMLGMTSSMALTTEHLPILAAIMEYYTQLPDDRKTFDSAAYASMAVPESHPPKDSFAAMLEAQGMEVPPPLKPADDTVTGNEDTRTPEQRAAFIASERTRIAKQHGVDPRDVIIFGEDDQV